MEPDNPATASTGGSRFDAWPAHKKALLLFAVLAACVLLLALIGELALRVRHGKLFQLQSFTAARPAGTGIMAYHPRLGWIPKSGQFDARTWSAHIGDSGLRRNGTFTPASHPPILLVGDSFTFGDEVNDADTWATHLEELLDTPVVNAGVGAYGIDQAAMRAELLVDELRPGTVILSFISDDITRTEYSYYPYGRGWKPYFELVNGSLALRNVPVPQGSGPYRLQWLRSVLGYSHLADFIFTRAAPGWWQNIPTIKRVHSDGESISVGLLTRLDSITRARGGRFVVVAFATNGRVGGNERLPAMIKRVREKGIEVLDLSVETIALPSDSLQRLFQRGGHYVPAMNRLVAERLATFLQPATTHR